MHAPKSPSAVPPFQDKAAAVQPGAISIRIGEHISTGSRDQNRNRDHLSHSPRQSSKAVWTRDGGTTAFTQTRPAFESVSSIENEQDRTPLHLGSESRTHTSVDGRKGSDERRTPTFPPVQPLHPLSLQTVDPSVKCQSEDRPQCQLRWKRGSRPALKSDRLQPRTGVINSQRKENPLPVLIPPN